MTTIQAQEIERDPSSSTRATQASPLHPDPYRLSDHDPVLIALHY